MTRHCDTSECSKPWNIHQWQWYSCRPYPAIIKTTWLCLVLSWNQINPTYDVHDHQPKGKLWFWMSRIKQRCWHSKVLTDAQRFQTLFRQLSDLHVLLLMEISLEIWVDISLLEHIYSNFCCSSTRRDGNNESTNSDDWFISLLKICFHPVCMLLFSEIWQKVLKACLFSVHTGWLTSQGYIYPDVVTFCSLYFTIKKH